jgi:integrase
VICIFLKPRTEQSARPKPFGSEGALSLRRLASHNFTASTPRIGHATAYDYRRSFATDAISNDVPDARVSELPGHSGTTMLHKHYAYLGAKADIPRRAGQGAIVRPSTERDLQRTLALT